MLSRLLLDFEPFKSFIVVTHKWNLYQKNRLKILYQNLLSLHTHFINFDSYDIKRRQSVS